MFEMTGIDNIAAYDLHNAVIHGHKKIDKIVPTKNASSCIFISNCVAWLDGRLVDVLTVLLP